MSKGLNKDQREAHTWRLGNSAGAQGEVGAIVETVVGAGVEAGAGGDDRWTTVDDPHSGSLIYGLLI